MDTICFSETLMDRIYMQDHTALEPQRSTSISEFRKLELELIFIL